MREVLFRGKSKHTGEWVTGAYVSKNWYPNKGVVEESNIISYEDGDECLWHLIIPETVGQYTGLTDKNGKKIFEGDIVAYGTNTTRATCKEFYEVVFETKGGSAYFGIKISDIETWQFCLEVPAKLMEVIGNIHDNPELLKGRCIRCVID